MVDNTEGGLLSLVVYG